jgi:hypothetical protein
MSGHAPANQLRLSLPSSDRVKPERDRVSGETNIGRKSFETYEPARAKITEPPYTDPYVRWCGRGGCYERSKSWPVSAAKRLPLKLPFLKPIYRVFLLPSHGGARIAWVFLTAENGYLLRR